MRLVHKFDPWLEIPDQDETVEHFEDAMERAVEAEAWVHDITPVEDDVKTILMWDEESLSFVLFIEQTELKNDGVTVKTPQVDTLAIEDWEK